MSLGPFGVPVGLPPEIERFFRGFASHWDSQQRVAILGVRPSGEDMVVRLLASRATTFVRVHVQHNGGGGGGEAFNSSIFVTDERIDCRVNRQQDYTVVRATGNDYFVWLIPEFLGDDGSSYIRFDGATDNGADHMAFVTLGANSQEIVRMRSELENIRELLTRLVAQGNTISGLDLARGEK